MFRILVLKLQLFVSIRGLNRKTLSIDKHGNGIICHCLKWSILMKLCYNILVINFRALLPHMYGDINKLFQCFVELVFFYFLFAHNIYSKLQHCSSIYKPFQSRALQDILQFSQYKPKCLNTAQVACP